jgi:DNA topoisomerase-2
MTRGARPRGGRRGGRSSTTKVSAREGGRGQGGRRGRARRGARAQTPRQPLPRPCSPGLGTSTEKEAKEYFAAIDSHRKRFEWSGDADGEALELAFSKKRADDRKAWLAAVEPGTYLDTSGGVVPIVDFVHRELVLFSRADLERSIPSAVDGLKPGQRKILFCAFKRGLTSDVKVAQLAGYVSEHSAYHHGEASLQGAIVGLAQDFVGSNNVNLLVPSGQFGTRLLGGKDAASARYIYTRLAPTTRSLFHPADDALLHYLEEEGQSIEPSWYVPLIPTALVNGADGIGTGWSTFVPNFNPRDLIASIRVLLGGGRSSRAAWPPGTAGSPAPSRASPAKRARRPRTPSPAP